MDARTLAIGHFLSSFTMLGSILRTIVVAGVIERKWELDRAIDRKNKEASNSV
jgi:hypothetical protein